MEKISKEIPSREESVVAVDEQEELTEVLESIEEERTEEDTEELLVEKPAVETSEESDTDKRLRQAMEGRIAEANEKIANLTRALEGRALNSVQGASVDHANDLEDKRDTLQKQLDTGEINRIEYARGIVPIVEALAKIIEAWDRTTKGQMLGDSKE